MAKKPVVVKHPAVEPWRDAFRAYSMKVGFSLNLTKPMLEFLCAVSDGVAWDRMLYFKTGGLCCPDNWIASEKALEKRGLVERKSEAEMKAMRSYPEVPWGESTPVKLTPAGKAMVELLKIAGLFIEADAAINKKSRRA